MSIKRVRFEKYVTILNHEELNYEYKSTKNIILKFFKKFFKICKRFFY